MNDNFNENNTNAEQPQVNETPKPVQPAPSYVQPIYAQPVPAPAPEKSKKGGRVGMFIGAVAVCVVVGLSAGFAGTMIANGIRTPDIAASLSPEKSTEASKVQSVPETLSNTSGVKPDPLDDERVNNPENTVLLNAEELYEKVKDSVVIVHNYQKVSGYSEPVLAGLASGILYTTDGYIVTNAHVVSGATKMTVIVNDYEKEGETHEYEAEVIGSDTATDIAVMKITRDEPFKCATLGNSDKVRVGQDICVLGNPKSLASSLTKGIVSGLGRTGTTASTNASAYECSYIQVDAAINGGNSGGGVFDMYGNVIGIVDWKLVSTSSSSSVENIGFAITINEAKPVINDLMTSGYVKNRPGIGINGEAISEYLAYTQGINTTGVYVTYISPTKPVANSGLRIGDIITSIDDESVATISDIQTIVSKHSIGDTIVLTVYRRNEAGNYRSTKVTVELSELTLD